MICHIRAIHSFGCACMAKECTELRGRHSSQEAFHMENLHLVQGRIVAGSKKCFEPVQWWNSVAWQELNPTWDEEDCICTEAETWDVRAKCCRFSFSPPGR